MSKNQEVLNEIKSLMYSASILLNKAKNKAELLECTVVDDLQFELQYHANELESQLNKLNGVELIEH